MAGRKRKLVVGGIAGASLTAAAYWLVVTVIGSQLLRMSGGSGLELIAMR